MSFLTNLFTAIDKKYKAIDYNISLTDYINEEAIKKIVVQDLPFKHIVIDNFFKPEFLVEIQTYSQEIFDRGLSSDHKDKSKFRFFDPKINYDGYVFSPAPTIENKSLSLFYSLEWNLFFSKIFNKPTTFGTNMAFHYHPPHDRTGWVHNDYATHTFPQNFILPNGVYVSADEELKENHTTTPSLIKNFRQKRTIALIYYFGDKNWVEGEGGETGLYSNKNKESLAKKVDPIHNRLLAFDVSPASYHAFQENLKERNSIVQWFHADLDWCEKKYGSL